MVMLLRIELKEPNPPRDSRAWIMAAFVLLGEMAEPAVPLLIELAQGPEDAKVTGSAIDTLGSLGPVAQKAAPVLAKLYFSKDNHPRDHELSQALPRFGEMITPFALDALKTGNLNRQVRAINLLSDLGRDAKTAIPELKLIAGDASHRLQMKAQAALKQIDRERHD